jgi:hypothetical protein
MMPTGGSVSGASGMATGQSGQFMLPTGGSLGYGGSFGGAKLGKPNVKLVPFYLLWKSSP